MNEATKLSTQNFKDLLVWQKGMMLARLIYQITGVFPTDERFGLVVQMRRTAVSIPSNIAEGQARHTTNSFSSFLTQQDPWPSWRRRCG
jgi:hypothetical protein